MPIKLAKHIAVYAIASPLVLAVISFLFPDVKVSIFWLFWIFTVLLNVHAFVEILRANKLVKLKHD